MPKIKTCRAVQNVSKKKTGTGKIMRNKNTRAIS